MDMIKNKSPLETVFYLSKPNKVSAISQELVDAARKEFNDKWATWCNVCTDQRNKSIDAQIVLGLLDKISCFVTSSHWDISPSDVQSAESEYGDLKYYIENAGKIKNPSRNMNDRNPRQVPGKVTKKEKQLESDKALGKQKKTNNGDESKMTKSTNKRASESAEAEEQGPEIDVESVQGELQESTAKKSAAVSKPKCNTNDDKGNKSQKTVPQDCISTNYQEKATYLSEWSDSSEISTEYHAIYVNEWKKVFDEIKEKNGQKASVQFLNDILRAAYDTNLQHADEQITHMMKEAIRVVRGETSVASNKEGVGDKEFLKEYRRRNAALSLPYLKRLFFENKVPALQREYTIPGGKTTAINIQAFVFKCIEVSWFACIQDLPMIIEFEYKPQSLDDLDNTLTAFKPGQQGNRIQFIVWPPLRLHKEGPVISRGIAELM